MKRSVFFCVLLIGAIGCERAKPPQPQTNAKRKSDRRPINAVVDLTEPADNLLELAHGAAVLSRTGEHLLEMSAAHVIDGDPMTLWKSPPNEPVFNDLVYALAAPARVTTVGVHAGDDKWDVPLDLRIDLSNDASAWREVAVMKGLAIGERRLANIAPTEARYVRVRILPGERHQYYTTMRSVYAKGQELAVPNMPNVAGCWTINGFASRFEQRGKRVFGVIGSNPPMFVSGALDARRMRLMWARGPQWGYALMTVDPQRKALSGVRWHEVVKSEHVSEGWFGEPSKCGTPVELDETRVAKLILARAGKWAAYGPADADVFAALIAADPGARFRVVARTPERLKIIDALLRKRGVDVRRLELTTAPAAPNPTNESMRVMSDVVELHVLR